MVFAVLWTSIRNIEQGTLGRKCVYAEDTEGRTPKALAQSCRALVAQPALRVNIMKLCINTYVLLRIDIMKHPYMDIER